MLGWRVILSAIAIAGVTALNIGAGLAQSYPNRPIKMIVPFPPGGPTDVIAASPAGCGRALGQTVVVENRPGGAVARRREVVATAEPDGYTLLFGSPAAGDRGRDLQEPRLRSGEEFRAGRRGLGGPHGARGASAVPVKTIAELVAHAKANPGKLNFGVGPGTPPHIAWGLFKPAHRHRHRAVPYRGAAPSVDRSGRRAGPDDHRRPPACCCRTSRTASCARSRFGRGAPAQLPDVPTMVEAVIRRSCCRSGPGWWRPPARRLRSSTGSTQRSTTACDRRSADRARPAERRGQDRSPQEFAAFIAAERRNGPTWQRPPTSRSIEFS